MSIMFFGEATRGWYTAMRELAANGKPIPKRMREALRTKIAADRAELYGIEQAIKRSEELERAARQTTRRTRK
jgi:hypothetical protein